MRRRPGKILGFVIIVGAIIVAAILMLRNPVEDIEDTNGADNYSLATITDEQIINKSLGSRNITTTYSQFLNKTVTISSKKFSGVYEVTNTYYLTESDYEVTMQSFDVTEGNFKMVVVNEGKIVATIEPGQTETVRVENVKGTVSLIIAGESAAFSITMSEFDFEMIGGKVD